MREAGTMSAKAVIVTVPLVGSSAWFAFLYFL